MITGRCYIMLKTIECDLFKLGGKDGTSRGTIVFHEGLNAVIGGIAGENSIGKSTFLLIVDFCFGGDSYDKSKVDPEMASHLINLVSPKKQIFIAFDKCNVFSLKTQKILADAKVLELGSDGKELFGYSWAKKKE